MTGRSRRRPIRQIVRESDGRLYDGASDEPVSRAELRDLIGDGGFIQVRRRGSGAICTAQVVRELLQDKLLPGVRLGWSAEGRGLGGDPLDRLGRLVAVAEAWTQAVTDRRDQARLGAGDPPAPAERAGVTTPQASPSAARSRPRDRTPDPT